MTEPHGNAPQMRCPYHGWTYSLEGELKGTPDFSGVCDFDRAGNGLIPVEVAVWEDWVFVRTTGGQLIGTQASGLLSTPEACVPISASQTLENEPIETWLSTPLVNEIGDLGLSNLHWFKRRKYIIECNWKVFVDNYLDGGY